VGGEEAAHFALDVTEFIINLPNVEEVKLRGLPSVEFSSILEHPRSAATFHLPCPNLRRLHIVSTLIRSPRPLLEELGKLLAEGKEAVAPFQSVMVEVKCELLIPAPEYRAFLTSWAGLVEEGVSLEYKQTEVKKFPSRRRRNYEDEGEEGDKVDSSGNPDDGCVG